MKLQTAFEIAALIPQDRFDHLPEETVVKACLMTGTPLPLGLARPLVSAERVA